MHDLINGLIEQITIMADHDHRMRVARQIIHEPERAFEIEIIGRLIKQQKIRCGEKNSGKGHAHTPPAREIRAGAKLCFRIKA